MTCLMKECPTRVRTGVPSFSRITSGTAHEQIRLWTIFAPGSRWRIALATSAVTSEPPTPSARSSTRNTRSAPPSNANPTSAPRSRTSRLRSRWFAGSIGSAGWFGNVPSSSGYRCTSVTGRRSNTAGTTRTPNPGEAPHVRRVDEGQDVIRVLAEELSLSDPAPRCGHGEPVPLRALADLAQPRILTDRPRTRETELHAVPLGRVVARG